MNQKSVNIILSILVIALIAVSVFLGISLKKSNQKVVTCQQDKQASSAGKSAITKELKPGEASISPTIDERTGWQTYDYAKKGFRLSTPKGWNGQVLGNYGMVLSDGKNQITVSILGDQPGRITTIKQDVEDILTAAVSKETPTDSLNADTYIKEELSLGSNTVYKVYNPAYLKGEAGSGYDFRLKNNAGFLELIVRKGSDEALVKSILEKVEIL